MASVLATTWSLPPESAVAGRSGYRIGRGNREKLRREGVLVVCLARPGYCHILSELTNEYELAVLLAML